MWNSLFPTSPLTFFPHSEKGNLTTSLLLTSIFITFILSAVYLLNPGIIRYFKNKSTDIILAKTLVVEPKLDIVTVDIDEKSIKKIGQWPWSRYVFGLLLKKIQDSGARLIGIDIIFPEKDRTSPKNRKENPAENFAYDLDTANIPQELLDHDVFLARILSQGPFVLGYEFLFTKEKEEQPACRLPPVAVSHSSLPGEEVPDISFYRAEGVICNYRTLTDATRDAGFLNGIPDDDGVLRRLPLLIKFHDRLYPSFPLAMLMKLENRKTISFGRGEFQINRLSCAGLHIPMDLKGNYFIGPGFKSGSTRYSAADILDGKVSPAQLQHKIVLVGASAAGLAQRYPTPFSQAQPLLDLQAAALQSLNAPIHPIRTAVFSYYEITAGFLASLFMVAIVLFCSTTLSGVLAALTAGAVCFGAGVLYQRSGLLFSPLLPAATVICDFLVLTSMRFRYYQIQAKTETGEALLLLKSSETSLESILRSIPDIVFRLDGSGNFTFISPAISRYIKFPQALLGKPILDFVAPEDRAKAWYRLNERRTGGRATVDLEIRLLLTKEDQVDMDGFRFFSVSAEGIYRENVSNSREFVGTQGIIKDITERKLLENRLIRAQKMEVVGNLAAGIAHDLNNILSGLVSYPDLLLLEIPKNDPLHDKIFAIQKSGQQAAVIVNDLLTLARRNVKVDGICNLNSIVTDYLASPEFLRLKEGYPHTNVVTRLDPDLLNVQGSDVHLSKVIMNLVHNAMEAMPAGGRIEVSTINLCLDTNHVAYESIPAGRYVCLSVADSGVGIAQKDLPRIFEPFYTRKKTAKSGTGLGMTIIWATVKDHKGYLDIASREGQGTTLTIYLPATEDGVAIREEKAVLEDYIGSETILLVEDIAEQRDLVENMLGKLGYTVMLAADGKQAVATMREQSVDLIILDMVLGEDMDGLDAYREILEVRPHQKAIITSSYAESDRVREAQRLGAGSYVPKPFTLEQIGLAVRKELDKNDS